MWSRRVPTWVYRRGLNRRARNALKVGRPTWLYAHFCGVFLRHPMAERDMAALRLGFIHDARRHGENETLRAALVIWDKQAQERP